MAPWKVVVYDGNDGQIRAGLGPWEKMGEWKRVSLLEQDAAAESKVRTMESFFEGLDVQVIEVGTREDCLAVIEEADVLVLCKGRVDEEMLDTAMKLREVHVLGADPFFWEAAAARGIRVMQVPLTNFLSVAEHTITLMLALLKRLSEANERLRAGTSWMVIPGNTRRVADLTIGLLGVGEIGYEVARLLKPWGARVVYNDLARRPWVDAEGAEFVSWQELFEQSDVVSVHLPENERTEKIVGVRELGWMKADALLINTGRGHVIDEEALIKALQEGQLGGAGLDVFAVEPLAVDHPLLQFQHQVVLTPHIGWAGPWTLVNDANILLESVARSIREFEVE